MKKQQTSSSINRRELKGIPLVYAIVSFSLLLFVVGCEKKTDAQKAKFEIDKVYEKGPLTAHVRVDKSKITIAQTLLLEVQAAVWPNYEVNMPKIDKVLENFGIVDWSDKGKTLDPNNRIVYCYQYRLEPFLSGKYALPSLTFEFVDVNTPDKKKYEIITDPIDIEVTSLLGEDRSKLTIEDIENVVDIPTKISWRWLWIISAAVIIGGGAGWALLNRKKAREIIRIFKPAHEIAYERLRLLVKDDLIAKGQIKEFYERISDILRHYIEHRFGLRAPERTTEEFLYELKSSEVLSFSDKEHLTEFMNHCDLVKFAKYSPTTEQIQKTFDLVKEFIEKTKSQEQKIDVTDSIESKQAAEIGSA